MKKYGAIENRLAQVETSRLVPLMSPLVERLGERSIPPRSAKMAETNTESHSVTHIPVRIFMII